MDHNEFALLPIPIPTEKWETAEASAAYHGNCAELQRLFAEGAPPNTSCETVIAPLEAAILGGQPDCVRIILEHPGFDPTPTKGVLDAFAHGTDSHAIAACCALAAPVVLGCKFEPFDNGPLPPALTLPHIIGAQAWILLLRFMRFNTADAKDRQRIARGMAWESLERDPRIGVPVLANILECCSDLMRHRVVQQCFCVLALSNSIAVPRELQPFLRLMPKEVVLADRYFLRWSGPGGLLSRWRSHLGTGVTPCLALDRDIPEISPTEEMVDHLLRACKITGRIRKGQTSPLLRRIIACASDETLRRQLQPGGALAALPREVLENAASPAYHSAERCHCWSNLLKEVRDVSSADPS